MEWLTIAAEIIRLIVGMYLTFTAVFSLNVKDAGVRFGVGLLLLASAGGN